MWISPYFLLLPGQAWTPYQNTSTHVCVCVHMYIYVYVVYIYICIRSVYIYIYVNVVYIYMFLLFPVDFLSWGSESWLVCCCFCFSHRETSSFLLAASFGGLCNPNIPKCHVIMSSMLKMSCCWQILLKDLFLQWIQRDFDGYLCIMDICQ